MRTSNLLAATLAVGLLVLATANAKDTDVAKDAVEAWFAKQATGLIGKAFMDKVKCSAFYKFFDKEYPTYYQDSGKTKMHIVNLCKEQRQIERDRRDLQAYAVGYFHDPEETELSTCEEFADDFVSEYSTFKGEKEEAKAYCHFFREEGNLNALRTVQSDHKEKTKHMDSAIEMAKKIHANKHKRGDPGEL